MYYYLRTLSFIKAGLGSLTGFFARSFVATGAVIERGKQKEVQKIEAVQKKEVDTAKQLVVQAAQRVVQLEQNVQKVEQQSSDKAHKKIVKLQTKVN